MKRVLSLLLFAAMLLPQAWAIPAAAEPQMTTVFQEDFENFAPADKTEPTAFGRWKLGSRNNSPNLIYVTKTADQAKAEAVQVPGSDTTGHILDGENNASSGKLLEVKSLTHAKGSVSSPDQNGTYDDGVRSEAAVVHLSDQGFTGNVRISLDLYAANYMYYTKGNDNNTRRDVLVIAPVYDYNYDNGNQPKTSADPFVQFSAGDITINQPNVDAHLPDNQYNQNAWNHIVIDIDEAGQISTTVNGVESQNNPGQLPEGRPMTDLSLYVDYLQGGWWYLDNLTIEHDFTQELNEAAASLSWNAIRGSNTQENIAREPLDLPNSLEGGFYTVEWRSDSPQWLDIDGVPHADLEDHTVTLTAVIRDHYCPEASVEKTFTVTVPLHEEEFYGKPVGTYQDAPYAEITSQDFSSGVPGALPEGWKMWSSSGFTSYVIDQDPLDAENQVFRIAREKEDIIARPFWSIFPTVTDNLEICFRFFSPVKNPDSSRNTINVILRGSQPDADHEGTAFGSIEFRDGDVGNKAGVYQTGIWNDARINLDLSGNVPVAHVYVNDVFATDVSMNNADILRNEGVGTVALDAPNAANRVGTTYVDDLLVRRDYSAKLKAAVDSIAIENLWDNDNVTQDLRLPATAGEEGYPVEWISENPDAIASDGTVTRRSFDQVCNLIAKVKLSEQIYQYQIYTLKVPGESGDSATPQTVLDEYAQYVLRFANLSDEAENNVTKNITLPTKGPQGISISWHSDQPDVISEHGVVHRPNYESADAPDATVNLTATLTKDGVSKTVSFRVTVRKLENPAVVIPAARAEIEEQLAAQGVVIEDALAQTGHNLLKDLQLPIQVESGAAITWASDNSDAMTDEGAITRGEDTQPVALTLTLTYSGETETVLYHFNVMPGEAAMVQKDIDAVNRDGWDALTGSFELPKKGTRFGSQMVWTSNSPLIVVQELAETYRFNVFRPEADADVDTKVTLSVTATNGLETAASSFEAQVVRLKSSAELIEDAYNTLTFDYIKAGNVSQENITQDLALPADMGNGVTVAWSCDKADLIHENGEVFCPLPGSAAQSAVLTATISRGYAEPKTREFQLLVQPFASQQELENKLRNSLTFDVLSDESINSVTQDLRLPSSWYYGSTIIWSSNGACVQVEAGEGRGRVVRPLYGSGNATAQLTASINYGGVTITKTFLLTVLEVTRLDGEESVWSENCENWSLGATVFTGTGSWTMASTNLVNNETFSAAEDPENHNNTVVKVAANGRSSGDTRYAYTMPLTGKISLGMRCYITDQSSKVSIMPRTSISGGASVSFENGQIKTVSYLTDISEKKAANLLFEGAAYPIGEWFDVRFDFDTNLGKYHVYLKEKDDESYKCISEEGKVLYIDPNVGMTEYDVYDSSYGVPFTYYASLNTNNVRPSNIQGFALNLEGGSAEAQVYFDDFYMTHTVSYTQAQLAAAAQYETQLLSQNNLDHLAQNLVLPSINARGITVLEHSDNTAVLSNTGLITQSDVPQEVNWIAQFSDGSSVYTRTYPVVIAALGDEVVSDEDAVKLDVADVIARLKADYLLSGLTKDLTLPTAGIRGSQLSYATSNANILTSDGKITRGAVNQSAILTITASKGGASATDTIEVTVKKEESKNDGGSVVAGTGSHGGGGTGGWGSGFGGGGGSYSSPAAPDNTQVYWDNEIQTPGGQQSSFADVPKDYWASEAIASLAKDGILNGTGDGQFEPERSINREEIVKMMVEALGLTAEAESQTGFADVEPGAWYAPYIAAAVEKGIVQGLDAQSFGVGQQISRQDLAVLLYRCAGLQPVSAAHTFQDDAQIADYAKEAVYALHQFGVINGKTPETFDPLTGATRAETAALLYRMIHTGLLAVR